MGADRDSISHRTDLQVDKLVIGHPVERLLVCCPVFVFDCLLIRDGLHCTCTIRRRYDKFFFASAHTVRCTFDLEADNGIES